MDLESLLDSVTCEIVVEAEPKRETVLAKEPAGKFIPKQVALEENATARAIMLGMRALEEKPEASTKPDKWWKIPRFCITCNGAGKTGIKRKIKCAACKGSGRLPELPKTVEPEKVPVKPNIPEERRAVMRESAWPVGLLFDRINEAKKDPAILASIRSNVRMLERGDAEVKVRAQYRDQALAFLGIYSDLDFWLASQDRIEYVVRLIKRMKPFGLTVRIEAPAVKPREAKELTPEQIAQREERKLAKKLLEGINVTLLAK